LVAVNRFHYNSNKDIYVLVMISYATAQYLFARGIEKAFIPYPASAPLFPATEKN
jgi:hypothetical protein